jgi:diadenylate cyclase
MAQQPLRSAGQRKTTRARPGADGGDLAAASLAGKTLKVGNCPPAIFEAVLELAIEIAREGREGRRIGTLLTIGHADEVLAASRPLILDPLARHPKKLRHITDPSLRGTIKELAQLDGAFVISERGHVVAACRYLNASGDGLDLPLGLGSRHLAAASISRRTDAVALVVSESAVVRIFERGELVAEVLPELWLLSRYHTQLRGDVHTEHVRDVAVLTPDASNAAG